MEGKVGGSQNRQNDSLSQNAGSVRVGAEQAELVDYHCDHS